MQLLTERLQKRHKELLDSGADPEALEDTQRRLDALTQPCTGDEIYDERDPVYGFLEKDKDNPVWDVQT